jgi:hypothetical protein
MRANRVGRDQGMDSTQPHNQVENATATSAGGSPDPGWESGYLFGRASTQLQETKKCAPVGAPFERSVS